METSTSEYPITKTADHKYGLSLRVDRFQLFLPFLFRMMGDRWKRGRIKSIYIIYIRNTYMVLYSGLEDIQFTILDPVPMTSVVLVVVVLVLS